MFVSKGARFGVLYLCVEHKKLISFSYQMMVGTVRIGGRTKSPSPAPTKPAGPPESAHESVPVLA